MPVHCYMESLAQYLGTPFRDRYLSISIAVSGRLSATMQWHFASPRPATTIYLPNISNEYRCAGMQIEDKVSVGSRSSEFILCYFA